MGAPDVLARLAEAGIKLTPLPDGRLWAEPAAQLTDELRGLIKAHRPELLRALDTVDEGDPAAEARRLRVLAMLEAHPGTRYAVLTDTAADPEAVLVVLAIRGQATCELRIPMEKYDGTLLLDLIEQHAGTEH